MNVEELLGKYGKGDSKEHQIIGVKTLLANPYFLLADEVGCGKTKQIIDTAQILTLSADIDTAVVVTPGFARSTWAEEDPLLGEVAKYAWDNINNVIHEFHKSYTNIAWEPQALNWVVTNYEFIRRADRLEQLLQTLKGRKVMLVLDESWAIKGFSDQMKACRALRLRRALRVYELNGTPLSDGKPIDLYYPMLILSPEIIGVQNRSHFKSKYCIMDARFPNRVLRYQNLDDLNARVAPYVLSRRTRDCWDLPPMLEPIIIEARMTPTTWSLYTDMRDDMVGFIGSEVSSAKQAIVKALRLSQITSGFLGGLEELDDTQEQTPADMPDWLTSLYPQAISGGAVRGSTGDTTGSVSIAGPKGPKVREIGREKLDATIAWIKANEPGKLLTWCRFRPELERATREFASLYPGVFNLKGGQTKDERDLAKKFLAPGGDPARRGACVGNQGAGGASLNFSGANFAIYMSNGPELIKRTQSIGRIERPGATQPMQVIDVVATGPKGQKTIDHVILKSLRSKDDMSTWTMREWRKIREDL